MSVVRDFHIIVAIKNTVVSVVSEEKQRSECSPIFHFNSTEVKQRSERSKRFQLNSSESKQPNQSSH